MKKCTHCKYFNGFYQNGISCALFGIRYRTNACDFFEQTKND